jgi:hypothetical protein
MLTAMARADLLINLVRTAQDGDEVGLRRTVESLIADEREKQHHLVAERLEDALRGGRRPAPGTEEPAAAGFAFTTPRRRLDELVLPDGVRA